MIIDEIKKESLNALKSKDTIARNVLSVAMSKIKLAEIEKKKELSDEEVGVILNKMIKELNDEKENYGKVGNNEQVNVIENQIQIISKYLPKMLSKEEISAIISKLEDKTIPAVMGHFKANYFGKCDMKLVMEVLKGN